MIVFMAVKWIIFDPALTGLSRSGDIFVADCLAFQGEFEQQILLLMQDANSFF